MVDYFAAIIQWLLCLLKTKNHHAAALAVKYIKAADHAEDILRSKASIVGQTVEHNILKPQNKMMYLEKH